MPRASWKSEITTVLSRIPQPRRGRRVVVLCYHSVHPSARFESRTDPTEFDRQMRWLREACEVVPFNEIGEEAKGSPHFSRPIVAVTFDDGHADNHAVALPILLRQGIPATFFVATGLIERDEDVIAARSWQGWRDTASTLTWHQIADLKRQGMEIGGHGHTHTALATMTDEEAVADLVESKRILEEQMGEPILTMSYPKGRPRRDVISNSREVARRVGFELGAAILLRGVRDDDDPMMIPRFPISADDFDLFRAKVAGRLDLFGTLQERAPISLLRRFGR